MNWCKYWARCGAYGEARERGMSHDEAKVVADKYMSKRKDCDCCEKIMEN